jgi:hypothetical protein
MGTGRSEAENDEFLTLTTLYFQPASLAADRRRDRYSGVVSSVLADCVTVPSA